MDRGRCVRHLGSTRSSLKSDHLLQTPDTFVRTPLPGASAVEFVVHTAPQLGAAFTQMTAEFSSGGVLGPAPAQRFVFVLEGELILEIGDETHRLAENSFASLPQETAHTVRAEGPARAVLIEKPYTPSLAGERPHVVIGSERDKRSEE